MSSCPHTTSAVHRNASPQGVIRIGSYPEFPLTAHPAGYWCKKIRGKLHYFGPWADADGALKKYLDQKDVLHAGRKPRPDSEALTVKDLVNGFLNHKRTLVEAGELSSLTWADYKRVADELLGHLGKTRLVTDLDTEDSANLRTKMAKKWGPHRLTKSIQYVRSIFRHAYESGLLVVAVFLVGSPRTAAVQAAEQPVGPAKGPLRAHPKNPRYFTDGSGKAIHLTGSHTWNALRDWGTNDTVQPLDSPAFVRMLVQHHHNFTLLWTTELPTFHALATAASAPPDFSVTPHPWQGAGPGNASDGNPKFALTKSNPAYFDRLRDRVRQLRAAAIYASVYLFSAEWLLRFRFAGDGYPLTGSNNINGTDDGGGTNAVTMTAPNAITAIQDFIRRYAERMNLASMARHGELVSTKHCLANPGQEYLVYLPNGGEAMVDLSAAPGTFRVEWMNPTDGTPSTAQAITGGAKRTLKAPFHGDAALYLKKAD